MMLLIAAESIKLECKLEDKKYSGFLKTVLGYFIKRNGASFHLLPFPDTDDYEDIETNKIKINKNKKVLLFWILILVFAIVDIFFYY